jgi:peptidoglycan hydrolase-like protein with peptidoglycan-binding domain
MRNALRRIAIGAAGAGMAVAMVAGPAALTAEAAVSAHTVTAVQPALVWPNVHKGESGLRVNAIQLLLIQHGIQVQVDGKFGPATEAAVKAFQAKNRLSVTGTVGTPTWEALIVTLWKGKKGPAVSALQIQLKFAYGFTSLSVDGQFGAATQAAVKKFQKEYNLTPDGIVGKYTWHQVILHDK